VRVFNRYLIILALASLAVNSMLAFAGQQDLTVYFTANAIAYLMITLLHVYMNPAARRSLSRVSAVLFASFAIVVGIKVVEVLSGV